MSNDNQLIGLRKQKYKKLLAMNVQVYPNRVERTMYIKELIDQKDKLIETNETVKITGRLKAMRRHGKIGFGNVEDETAGIQIYVRKDVVGDENYEIYKLYDLGDFVGIEGVAFVTESGEFSIKATKVAILAKSLRPLPTVKEKIVDGKKVRYDEFSDIELRYRKRYLDLLLNPQNKNIFIQRSKIISNFRKILDNDKFLEVETPILQPLYGGANARPFITHHNTLNIDLYLRIATELYLKRLIIGGFERVYEIGKNFRNEGMDKSHNPEFTAIEIYQAYADYNDMMDLTEKLMSQTAIDVIGTDLIEFEEKKINLKSPWRRATMIDLIKEHTGFDASDFDYENIKNFCESKGIEIDPNAGPGKLITEIFETFVEAKLIQPTFVTDFPKEVSPLAKTKPNDKKIVERFELYINGSEFANAFTELNDPIDQRERLESQAKLRELGDLEANVVDEDFLEAMEYGMPPTGGLGIGIDRFVMLLTKNTSIKEVLLFPQMKPEEISVKKKKKKKK